MLEYTNWKGNRQKILNEYEKNRKRAEENESFKYGVELNPDFGDTLAD